MNTSEAPTITYQDIDKRKGTIAVQVKFGDKPSKVLTVNILNEKSREKLKEELEGILPPSAGIDIEKELLKFASKFYEDRSATDPALIHDQPSRSNLLAKFDSQTLEALATMPREVKRDAEAMLLDRRLIDRIDEDIEHCGVVGERELALGIYMTGTSRLLLDGTLNAVIQGLTSSGKDFLKRRCATLFPDEAVVWATDWTPQSLYYGEPGSLIHRFVVGGERQRLKNDDQANASKAFRELASDGELNKLVTMKVNGQFHTVRLRQDGPIAYVETTSQTRIFDEDANRCLLMSTDESEEQTRAIVEAAGLEAMLGASDPTAIIQRHHAMQRMLKRVHIRIPFADRLTCKIPTERPEARRVIGQVFGMIHAAALLNQRQRAGGPVKHGDTIEATIDDYVVARRLLADPLSRALGLPLPRAVMNFAKRLRQRYSDRPFTLQQATKDDPTINSSSKVSEYLNVLATSGVAKQVIEEVTTSAAGMPGRPALHYVILKDGPTGGALWLPNTDEVLRDAEQPVSA